MNHQSSHSETGVAPHSAGNGSNDALQRLSDRLDRLEQTADRIEGLLTQAPGLLSMATDSVDEVLTRSQARGIDVEQRLIGLLGLTEHITRPENLEAFHQLTTLLEQAPGLMGAVTDMLDEAYQHAEEAGIHPPHLGQMITKIARALTEAAGMPTDQVTSVWGLARAFRDPERRKAFNWLLNVTKSLGKQL